MGSKNGKYDFDHTVSNKHQVEHLPSSTSDADGTIIKTRNTCIQRELSIDMAEHISLVWLDTDVFRRTSNIDMEVKLKNLIGYVRLFDRVDACERYIKQIGKFNNHMNARPERLLVMISAILASTLIPHLHDMNQVKYIYIFGKVKSLGRDHPRWLRKYPKVSQYHFLFLIHMSFI